MHRQPRRGRRAALRLLAAALCLAAPAILDGQGRDGGSPPLIRRAQLPDRTVQDLAPGKFLVAQTGLVDPNFRESVVLLVEYGPKGATGLILNRRTRAPLSSVLQGARGRGAALPVFFGGPVEEPGVMALMRSGIARQGAKHVFADVYVVVEPALLSSLVDTAGPDSFRVFVGYSGWGEGQLARETKQGAWKVVSGVSKLVFDPDPDSLWPREQERAGERAAWRPGASSTAG
jgi:putative transcriptional regulator